MLIGRVREKSMRDYYLRIKFSFSSCSPAAIDEPWERQDLSPEPVVSLFLMVNETDGALGAVCRCAPAIASLNRSGATQSPSRNKQYSQSR